MKYLLIGNGINLTNSENEFLNNESVYERFILNLDNYWKIIHELVDLKITESIKLKNDLEKNKKAGIETIAGMVFEYFQGCIELNGKMNRNYLYRLVEILAEISLKSIFFKENKIMVPTITQDYLDVLKNNYDKILTLNYIESWDKDNKVEYLHGKLNNYVESYCDIGSMVLSANPIYEKFKAKNYAKIDFKTLIFMPLNLKIDKENYIIKGLLPGDDLYPADDLFPYDGKDIYLKLDSIDDIDIFGLSPYGDDAIIEKIKKIRNKRIYVYQMNTNEIKEWEKHGIKNCFIDSKDFLKNRK